MQRVSQTKCDIDFFFPVFRMVGKSGRSGRPCKPPISTPPAESTLSARPVGRPKKEEEPASPPVILRQSKRLRIQHEDGPSEAGTSESETRNHVTTRNQGSSLKDKLIGKPTDSLSSIRLPSKRDVMQRWRGLTLEGTLDHSATRSNASICSDITEEVLAIWGRSAIPTIRVDSIKGRMLDLITSWNMIRRLKLDHPKCVAFSESLDHLFDIAHADVENILGASTLPSHAEDLAFYKSQVKDTRSSSMGGVDVKMVAVKHRRQQRDEKAKSRQQHEAERKKVAAGATITQER